MQTVNRSQTLFVGVDVHKDTHTAVGLSSFGEKVFEMTIGNETEDFISLVEKTKVEAEKSGLIPSFGLEDVHSWGERLSSFLVEEGLPVRAVAPILVDHRRSKMTHPEKSDSLDASGVAEVMIQKIDSLPLYKVTEEAQKAKQIRELSLEREWLVKERSRLKNQLHILLHRIHNTGYRAKFKDPFSKKALLYWSRSIPKNTDAILAQRTKRALRRILDLREEIQEIEEELETMMKENKQTLSTASGCGTVIAAEMIGEIGDIARFHSPEHWLSMPAALRGNTPRARPYAGEKQSRATDDSIVPFTEWHYRKSQGRAMTLPECISRERYPKAKQKRRLWSACVVSWSMWYG